MANRMAQWTTRLEEGKEGLLGVHRERTGSSKLGQPLG